MITLPSKENLHPEELTPISPDNSQIIESAAGFPATESVEQLPSKPVENETMVLEQDQPSVPKTETAVVNHSELGPAHSGGQALTREQQILQSILDPNVENPFAATELANKE